MSLTKYTYSITGDFPNDAVAIEKLVVEIDDSSITTALDHVETAGDVCDIWFDDALSGGDETTLDGLVAAHDGVSPVGTVGSYVSSEGESSTTSTDWTEKLTCEPGWFRAGDYAVDWSCEVKSSTPKTKLNLRVQLDDTTTLGESKTAYSDDMATDWVMQAGFTKTTLTAGTHTFDMDFSSEVQGGSVLIRRARLRVRAQ
jgi:hypothetical protein